MNRFSFKIALTLCFLVSACSVHKQLVPTGGSRADGTVKLSYEYGLFEQPVLDAQQGQLAAKQRCAAWGYSDAEAFGGVITNCIDSSRNGCNRWMATMEYQCTGTGNPGDRR